MSHSPKKQPHKSSCSNRSCTKNDHDQTHYSRNAQSRPQKLTFAEDYHNQTGSDSFYSCNQSQIDPNLSIDDASFYTAGLHTPPRSDHNISGFAQSTPKRQRPPQTPYYRPSPPTSRTLPECCRTGQDSYDSSRGADMSSGYFNRSQANSSRGPNMSSGYFDRSQANSSRGPNMSSGSGYSDRSQANSSRGPNMSSGYFDRSQANSSRGPNMSSGYFDRSQANSSRGPNMSSGYFDRSQANSSRGPNMKSGYYNCQDNSSRGADMTSGYFDSSQNSSRGVDVMRSANDRSCSNSSRAYNSHSGQPFTHVSRNDTTPFSFVDQSQPRGVDMSARNFDRCPGRSSPGSPYTHISRNDTTPFAFMDESQARSTNAGSCPGSSFTHISPNDTTPFTLLDESQASSYGTADMSSGFFDSTNNNDFSMMDDANDLIQHNDPIPQRMFKPNYCAANAVPIQKNCTPVNICPAGNMNYLPQMSRQQNISCRSPLPEQSSFTTANPVDDAFQMKQFPSPCSGKNNPCKEPSLNEINSKTEYHSAVGPSEVVPNEKHHKSKIPRKTPSKTSKSLHPHSKDHSETSIQEDQKLEDTKQDSINMLSVVISTVMLLAAGVPNIPPNYLTWSVKYLKCIKNMQGQYPANVKKILKMLAPGEEFDKILKNENNCKCPYTPCQ